MKEKNCQSILWGEQHSQRNISGPEGTFLRDVPTPPGYDLISLIPQNSRILEIGSANGRDARFWAKNGHNVDCIDFSKEALDQLEVLAIDQNISDKITTHLYDVSDGLLPSTLPANTFYDAFFARSSLTINDEALFSLTQNITKRMKPNGIILIEGRSPLDPKIIRSKIDGNMADDNGHFRRIYTGENMTQLSLKNGWTIEQISENIETGFESPLHMLRLVARCQNNNRHNIV
jgi:SAM-dependent methyltransferase